VPERLAVPPFPLRTRLVGRISEPLPDTGRPTPVPIDRGIPLPIAIARGAAAGPADAGPPLTPGPGVLTAWLEDHARPPGFGRRPWALQPRAGFAVLAAESARGCPAGPARGTYRRPRKQHCSLPWRSPGSWRRRPLFRVGFFPGRHGLAQRLFWCLHAADGLMGGGDQQPLDLRPAPPSDRRPRNRFTNAGWCALPRQTLATPWPQPRDAGLPPGQHPIDALITRRWAYASAEPTTHRQSAAQLAELATVARLTEAQTAQAPAAKLLVLQALTIPGPAAPRCVLAQAAPPGLQSCSRARGHNGFHAAAQLSDQLTLRC